MEFGVSGFVGGVFLAVVVGGLDAGYLGVLYCVVAVWVVFGLVGHLVISCGVCECLVLMVVVWVAVDWRVGYEC